MLQVQKCCYVQAPCSVPRHDLAETEIDCSLNTEKVKVLYTLDVADNTLHLQAFVYAWID